jgi:adenylosuccinate lyase
VIERYTLPEMAAIRNDRRKLETWLTVELAIVDALAARGRVPHEAASRIRRNARFDLARVEELEKVTKHDVLSFVECVGESLGADSRYFHMGVTSSDVLDTALGLLIKDANRLVLDELEELRETIGSMSAEHANTLTIGRTHGMHAEPTSLGLKFAVWWNELGRAVERVRRAGGELAVGKVSGSVGNYSHLSPEVEDTVMAALGLRPERPATQIVQRDRHADYLASLALAAGAMERIGVELRHLQRTEVSEAEEPFAPGQKGSSSMPHKRNPIALERVCGLARLVRANAIAGLENVALWHERDISHSSAERVIIPDSTITVHYMARLLRGVLAGLRIDTRRMRANIDLTSGLIYSQRLMLSLVEEGWDRRRAYEKAQGLAADAASAGRHLREVSRDDAEVASALGNEGIDRVFDPAFYVRHAGRVLGDIGIGEEERG